MTIRIAGVLLLALPGTLVGLAAAQKGPTPLSQAQIDAVLQSTQDARARWDFCGTDGKTYITTYKGILLARAGAARSANAPSGGDAKGKALPETIAPSPDPGRVVAVRAYPDGPEFNEQANAYIGGGTITSLVMGTRGGEHVIEPLRIELHEGIWRNLIKHEIGRYQWAEALFDYDAVSALPPGDIHLLSQGNASVCRVHAKKRAEMFE